MPLSPVCSSTLSQATAIPDINRIHSGDSRPTLTGVDIRKMLASPGKMREIALLSELLQPPLALRRASPIGLEARPTILTARPPQRFS